jgi:hypothetical protein
LATPGTNALFTRLAVLGGGLYLIGRCIANISDGLKKLSLYAGKKPISSKEKEERAEVISIGIYPPITKRTVCPAI